MIEDAEQVRKQIGAAMARVGQEPGAKGAGNPEKRLRLVIEATSLSPAVLAGVLARKP